MKSFRKRNKIIYIPAKKQIEALKVLKPVEQELSNKDVIPKKYLNQEVKSKLEQIKKLGKMVHRKKLIYKANKYKYNLDDLKQ